MISASESAVRKARWSFRGRQASAPEIVAPPPAASGPTETLPRQVSSSETSSQRRDGALLKAAKSGGAAGDGAANGGKQPAAQGRESAGRANRNLFAVPGPAAGKGGARTALEIARATVGRRKSIADQGDASMAHLHRLYDALARSSTTKTVTYTALAEVRAGGPAKGVEAGEEGFMRAEVRAGGPAEGVEAGEEGLKGGGGGRGGIEGGGAWSWVGAA